MSLYTTSSRKSITTSHELGKGGEGIVYSISGDSTSVAKIYHASHRTNEKQQKLYAMIANPPQDDTRRLSPPHVSIAWPTGLLFEQGHFAGYIMPRINRSPNIFEVYNPRLRIQNNITVDWRFLHRTAKNFATSLNTLHVRDCVIGDVNQKNIMVTNSAMVTLVDTDSFQVRDSKGIIHRCPVGVPEYTPPELQGTKLDAIDRNIYHDGFGLGVIIFQLLMEGFHPFTGAPKNPTLSIFGEIYLHCIKQGIFPYQPNNQFVPPPNAPNFTSLHPEIQSLFLRCFVNGHLNPSSRPSAREWLDSLGKAEQSLIQCSRNSSHWYSSHANKCQWCEREKQKPSPVQKPLPPIAQVTPKPTYYPPSPTPTSTSKTSSSVIPSITALLIVGCVVVVLGLFGLVLYGNVKSNTSATQTASAHQSILNSVRASITNLQEVPCTDASYGNCFQFTVVNNWNNMIIVQTQQSYGLDTEYLYSTDRNYPDCEYMYWENLEPGDEVTYVCTTESGYLPPDICLYIGIEDKNSLDLHGAEFAKEICASFP